MTDNQFEAKEWLNRMFGAAQDVESTRRTLETIVAEMGGVSKYEIDFRGNNPKATEDKLARYSMIRAELDKKEQDLYYEDSRTEKIIDKLKDRRERAILRDRYINRLSWSRIAKLNNYSEARVYELHRTALDNVWKYIPGRNGNV